MQILITVINLFSFFAGVLCLVSWYNAALPIYKDRPWVVMRGPALIGAIAVLFMSLRGSITGGWLSYLLVFLVVTVASSFVLCFLYGWLFRGKFDDSEVKAGNGRFTPVMLAWSAGLGIMLLVTALNGAVHNEAVPFYVG